MEQQARNEQAVPIRFNPESIKHLRSASGLNHYEFAKKIKTSRQMVHQWERGDCAPRIQTLERIMDVFRVGPEYFFSRNPKSN